MMVIGATLRRSAEADATAASAALDAVLFDMDGVVLDTARLHAAAWKDTFDHYLKERARERGEPFRPFDAGHEYRAYVDGRPRYDGVHEFLRSRGIELPWGEETDDADSETVCGIGNRKNRRFREMLESEDIRPFPGALRLIRELRKAGLRLAIFSASRNAALVLQRAGADHLFDVRVDGVDLDALGLPGKPHPGMLVTAAERLGSAPGRTAVIEDSVAGIEAGVRGGFACMVGIDRGGNAAALRQAGAELLVEDCGELAPDLEGRIVVRTLNTLPQVWDARTEVSALLRESEPLVFLDYDGTLTPIVPDPDKALLPETMRETLAELAGRCTVTVVTGRDLAAIRDLVALPGLTYAGSHGFEVRGPEGRRLDLEKGLEFLPALDEAETALRDRLAGIPGHLVERQRFSLAVHYRHASPPDAARIEEVLDQVLAEVGRLRKGSGKKVFRVQPDTAWDKGHAVLWLEKRLGSGGASLTIYLGDDVTDEDAFRALAGRGLCIAVRGEEDRPTSADFTLADTDDVRRFLQFLAQECMTTEKGGAR